MDLNCIVEWEEFNNQKLNDLEKETIRSYYLPLNYQHTTGILSKEHRKVLSTAKKAMKF